MCYVEWNDKKNKGMKEKEMDKENPESSYVGDGCIQVPYTILFLQKYNFL